MDALPSLPNKSDVLEAIRIAGIIAVIRTDTADDAIGATHALLTGGVRCIEITYTIPNATEVIARLASDSGSTGILLGAGTVLTAAQANDAIDAGARFLVSPCLVREVLAVAAARGVAVMPGAFSPTEIFTAHSLGADVVKVFPASHFGPHYFKELRGPLPHLPLLPSGGVDAGNAGEWLRAGAFALGAGSRLVDPDAVRRGDWALIAKNARALVEAVQEARAEASVAGESLTAD